ncbi:PpiC-type peptidyl-prolyl cis-trans isomerase [Cylindrospermum sp. NIES-4074]|jgi:parvulin-like peptidyl-prolyl isomerase|nr:PpiC-type peptidyl-prolyl cis-trans isomerase [Cylindrospermum sp. NIES-4074]
MKEQLEPTIQTVINNQQQQHQKTLTIVPVPPATDAEILVYLRRSAKLSEIAALAERDAFILGMCEQLEITISDAEWQAAGDAFRLERQLWGTAETLAWLKQQRIRIQDWSQGIKVKVLEKKLKEYLFGETVDSAYISNNKSYRRVALSQILVFDLTTAEEIWQMLQEENGSFCILAMEHSQGKLSQQNGGFVGIRSLVELLPEIAAAVNEAKEGEIIGPIQTKLGYHILKLEKWFPSELTQSIREQIMNTMFEVWLEKA